MLIIWIELPTVSGMFDKQFSFALYILNWVLILTISQMDQEWIKSTGIYESKPLFCVFTHFKMGNK